MMRVSSWTAFKFSTVSPVGVDSIAPLVDALADLAQLGFVLAGWEDLVFHQLTKSSAQALI
jgi:hypothetical protein